MPAWLLLLAACGGRERPAEAPRPDIVLVVVDTLRADHTGAWGYERPTTPALDALAAEGLRFSRAYAQASWTLPSFCTLLTGLYPFEHRVGRDDIDPRLFGRLDPSTPTLPGLLRAAGYRTAAFVNNTFLAPEFGLRSGFDRYDWQGATNAEHRSAGDTVAAALAWLAEDDAPAFALVHFMEPHLDYLPPPDLLGTFGPPEPPAELRTAGDADPFSLMQLGQLVPSEEGKRWTIARYDEEVLAADRALGELVAGLRARGRPVVVAFTADHGEEFWEHGGFEHGHALWSEITHVPLVLWGTGVEPGTSDVVVEHVDLFRTLLAVGGAEPPAGGSGEDLRALVRTPPAEDRVAFSEGVLYGAPKLSAVDREARVVFDIATGTARAWRVGPDGDESARMEGPEGTTTGRRLLGRLRARRGGLAPVRTTSRVAVPSFEVFSQLATLGYIDER